MKSSVARHNVAVYKMFVIFNEPLFWGPIVITSIQKLGKMTLSEIYFMEAAVMVLCVLLNIPTGVLADTIGRKKTLIIGRLFLLGSTVFFAITETPLDAWIANILWAIGFSFQSGADHALLYSTLKSAGAEKSFQKIEGCAVGFRLFVIAFCSLVVGPLAEINLRYPLYLSIPFVCIPLVTAFFFKEQALTEKCSARKQYQVLKKGVMCVISNAKLRWIIGFCALILGASKIWFFTYNPYFEKVEIPLKYFGVIFFFLNMVAWFSSHFAHSIESRFGEKRCVLIMITFIGVPILVMGMFPFWPMAMLVIVQNFVRGFMRPFVSDFMNKHINSDDVRATALSVRSTLTDIVSILSLAWFGFVDESLGLLNALIVLGILVLVLGSFSFAHYKRLFPESSGVS